MYWIIIVFLLSITFMTLFFSVNISSISLNMKNSLVTLKSRIDKNIEENKAMKLGKIIEYTDNLIVKSNIKVYINYNVYLHFIVCVVLAIVLFNWMNGYMNVLISLAFSIIGLLLPYTLLQLIYSFTDYIIRKNSVDFLIILKNFFISTGDIFVAIEQAKEYFPIEPLKTYLDIMIYEYKNKINPIRCIDGLIQKINNDEMRAFFENVKITYLNGSDMLLLIDTFINDINSINDDMDNENTEDKILSFGLYTLLIFNYLIIYALLNSRYRYEITNTVFGQAIFIVDIAISIYIIFMTLDFTY